MFYTNEMIANMGFDSVDTFVEDYKKRHPNCCIRFVESGVYCDYDVDSQRWFERPQGISSDSINVNSPWLGRNFNVDSSLIRKEDLE